MQSCTTIRAIAAGLLIAGLAAAAPARAAVIGNDVNIDFSGTTTSFALTPGASYTLYGTNGDIFNPVDVSTAGTAMVKSLGAPFYDPPQPTSEFTNRGTVVYGSGDQYSAFSSQTNIRFSLNDTFIGLALQTAGGTNYGYARFNGTVLLAYGYETVAGRPIVAGTAFTAPIGDPVAVPEPASLALFGMGLAGLAMARRRRA